jgi:uncharacterized DUF497 family protein
VSVILEWDEAKREANLEKHYLDFADAHLLFVDGLDVFEYESVRNQEIRFARTAPTELGWVTVVWTPRGGWFRIISMRRSRDGEKRSYRQLYPGRATGDA